MEGSKSKTAFPGANRPPQFMYPPETFTLVDDPSHPLYDPRVHNPVSNELVESIMDLGIIQAITVTKNGDAVEVVDGRQRVKATLEANRRFQEAGVEKQIKVPFVYRKDTDARLLSVTVAANELRTDDKPLVKAEKAQRLLSYGMTEREVAITFGISLPALKKIIAMLDLCPAAREALESGELSVTAASKLAPLSRAEQKKRLESMQEQGGRITADRVERESRGDAITPVRKMRKRKEILEQLAKSGDSDEFGEGFRTALRWVLCEDPETADI